MKLVLQYFMIVILIFSISVNLHAQFGKSSKKIKNVPDYTPAEIRLESYKQRLKLQHNSLVANVEFRSVGPTIMSGRVADIDANPADPTQFYVAYASGGLWKTENNGITFKPLFDDQPVMTIGDIAVDWDHNETIWVGTGENNASRSSYSGTGIYKSIDLGKSWYYMGLAETHHCGRIIIHPENPDIVWVAAMGHLYSANEERGVYKTVDGGRSWEKTLYVGENTGAIDLIIDPNNPAILYASMWEKTRRAWNIEESGTYSGIYKSTNGGENWELLTSSDSGFPQGKGVGRIGLDIYPQNPNIIYAFLDNQFSRKKEENEHALTKEMLRKMSKNDFIKIKSEDINDFLDRFNFPMKYHADTLYTLVTNGTIKPATLVEFLEDANTQLFDTPVIGGEVYISNDGGKTWNRTHEEYIDNFVNSYGYYFGEIRVSTNNKNLIYVLGVPILKSDDGGLTFSSIGKENVHGDHHALWLNPNKEGHLILGNDGGINISYDFGQTWFKANSPTVGQFYTVAVDMAKPYNVYGGLQDNGVWMGPSTYNANFRWHGSGNYPYDRLLGGDGMQVEIDTRTNDIVYTGFQFGYYYRVEKSTGKRTFIKPLHSLGERPYRFNWQSPIHLSVHNQDILYFGSQMLHRSFDRGDHWEATSEDLTKGGIKGDVPYGTLTSSHESPLKFGLIDTGSDDGLIHITEDGGNTWERISDNLPPNFWVSRIQASAHDEGTVYASLNGYRWDNFEALVYKSTDYGKNWKQIGKDLPLEPINVIKEDPVNKKIIYVGTDHALYVSLDAGKSFMGIFKNLPHAPVHDLVIHPREHDFVVGTHGRSIFIADVEHLQKLDEELMAKMLHIFGLQDRTYNKRWGNLSYNRTFINSDSLVIPIYCKDKGQTNIKIYGDDDFLLKTLSHNVDPGLNYIKYDLSVEMDTIKSYLKKIIPETKDRKEKIKAADNGKTYLRPGKYMLTIELNDASEKQNFEMKEQKKKTRKTKKKTP